jgi:hypothetical protein
LPLTDKESDAMYAISEMRQYDYADQTINADLASRDLLRAANQVRARQRAEKLFQELERQRQVMADATMCRVLREGNRTGQIIYPLGRKGGSRETAAV